MVTDPVLHGPLDVHVGVLRLPAGLGVEHHAQEGPAAEQQDRHEDEPAAADEGRDHQEDQVAHDDEERVVVQLGRRGRLPDGVAGPVVHGPAEDAEGQQPDEAEQLDPPQLRPVVAGGQANPLVLPQAEADGDGQQDVAVDEGVELLVPLKPTSLSEVADGPHHPVTKDEDEDEPYERLNPQNDIHTDHFQSTTRDDARPGGCLSRGPRRDVLSLLL